jgi:hypothetical protein
MLRGVSSDLIGRLYLTVKHITTRTMVGWIGQKKVVGSLGVALLIAYAARRQALANAKFG